MRCGEPSLHLPRNSDVDFPQRAQGFRQSALAPVKRRPHLQRRRANIQCSDSNNWKYFPATMARRSERILAIRGDTGIHRGYDSRMAQH